MANIQLDGYLYLRKPMPYSYKANSNRSGSECYSQRALYLSHLTGSCVKYRTTLDK